ncbi:MAG: hypothetical protein ACLQUZ_18060 [Rhizomicrobium sp.]
MRQVVAGTPKRSPLLQQPWFAGFECLDVIQAIAEFTRRKRIGIEYCTIGSQQLKNIGAKGAIFLRYKLARFTDE